MTKKIADEEKESIAPRTPAEELISEIYTGTLTIGQIGVFENLPLLNASQAAWVQQVLQKIFHVEVPMDRLLAHTTIDSLVNFLSDIWEGREVVDEIAWTFLQIKKLSDDEVRSQLTIETGMNRLSNDA